MERKQSLHLEQKVTDLSAVDEAATWADLLERREFRGPGDTLEAARLRAARKHKVPERAFWSLRYRKPKDIAGSIYRSLQRAVAAEVERQEAKLAHQLEITKALPPTAARIALIAETEALLGRAEGSEAAAPTEPARTASRRPGNLERRQSRGRRSTD